MRQALIRKLAARHDFAVAFQRHPLVFKRHGLEQLRDRDRVVQLSRFAVNRKLYQVCWNL